MKQHIICPLCITLLSLFCCVNCCYSEEITEDTQAQLPIQNDEVTKLGDEASSLEQNEQVIDDLKEKYEKKIEEELNGKKLAQFRAMKKFVERNRALKDSGMDIETRKVALATEFGL
jgi:molybdopterin converting factor small subunit